MNRRPSRPQPDLPVSALLLLFVLGAAAVGVERWVSAAGWAAAIRPQMELAARLMAEALETVRACRIARLGPPDPASDPNATGLIGAESSPITTTSGDLEAKRTAASPEAAALLAALLRQAGAREGDAVAIGASGSFPGLLVACLSALKALGLHPVTICSVGASSWGANVPGFTLADMIRCLEEGRLLPAASAAVSLGGMKDIAEGMESEGQEILLAAAQTVGAPLLWEPEQAENVRRRMAIYRDGAAGRRLAAFVNIGGGEANLGVDAAVLGLKPGLNRPRKVRRLMDPRGSVIGGMAAQGVPVIHLLNLRGLALRYGLSWDPVPLPAVGEGGLFRRPPGPVRPQALAAITGAYLAAAVAVLLAVRRRRDG